MKRRSIKYIGLVLLCVAGCMFMAACGQDKESAVRNDEGSVLSDETEAKDVEKSTDPADYEIGTRDHYLAVWAQEKGLSYVEAESQERLETDKIALSEEEAIGYATVDKECGSVSNGSGCNVKTASVIFTGRQMVRSQRLIIWRTQKYIFRRFRVRQRKYQIRIFIRKREDFALV